nr:3-oxoacyl-[acyl-carrier protein] reductase [Kibdelosporangium sp. MJ126-NF4]CTQ90960.1 3-oxoacyl-[acyl-carrier protein] reductase (EC 1.1.1.100) [Kibdelosporangium sp. MJ126-NF4]
MSQFTGKTALVTGASKGIGRAIACDLAAAGATVLLNSRQASEAADEALALVREHRPDAEPLYGDVSDGEQVARMFKQVRADHDQLDILVSNAGIAADGHALMMGDQKWRSVLDTNLTGAFQCCRAAGRLMMRQRAGAIVAVSSTSGFQPPAGQVNYAAAKAGVLAMVRVLAKELGAHGIRVNAVAPGFVDTAMTRTMPRAELDAHLARVPLGRIGQPADVTGAVRFLLSEEAAYVTGTTVVVDGGMTC